MGRVLGNASLDDYSASARAIAALRALHGHPTVVAPPGDAAIATTLMLLALRLERAGRLDGRGCRARAGRWPS